MLYPVAIFSSCVCSHNLFFRSSAMASTLQSAFVTALRHCSATDPDGVTKEISAMLAPRSRIFKTLSLNDCTHLFALHTDLTIGPVGGSGPSTRSRTRRNLLPVGVSALGGVRPPPISVSQPDPKRRCQVVPPVEVPPTPKFQFNTLIVAIVWLHIARSKTDSCSSMVRMACAL